MSEYKIYNFTNGGRLPDFITVENDHERKTINNIGIWSNLGFLNDVFYSPRLVAVFKVKAKHDRV